MSLGVFGPSRLERSRTAEPSPAQRSCRKGRGSDNPQLSTVTSSWKHHAARLKVSRESQPKPAHAELGRDQQGVLHFRHWNLILLARPQQSSFRKPPRLASGGPGPAKRSRDTLQGEGKRKAGASLPSLRSLRSSSPAARPLAALDLPHRFTGC